MKIEPNRMVGANAECLLCEGGAVFLHDGTRIPMESLDDAAGPFRRFCSRIDANCTFIQAFVPDNTDDVVFYRVRDVAASMGIHAQAPKDRPEALRRQWEAFCQVRRLAAPPA